MLQLGWKRRQCRWIQRFCRDPGWGRERIRAVPRRIRRGLCRDRGDSLENPVRKIPVNSTR